MFTLTLQFLTSGNCSLTSTTDHALIIFSVDCGSSIQSTASCLLTVIISRGVFTVCNLSLEKVLVLYPMITILPLPCRMILQEIASIYLQVARKLNGHFVARPCNNLAQILYTLQSHFARLCHMYNYLQTFQDSCEVLQEHFSCESCKEIV